MMEHCISPNEKDFLHLYMAISYYFTYGAIIRKFLVNYKNSVLYDMALPCLYVLSNLYQTTTRYRIWLILKQSKFDPCGYQN
jgi:hypothetical protein